MQSLRSIHSLHNSNFNNNNNNIFYSNIVQCSCFVLPYFLWCQPLDHFIQYLNRYSPEALWPVYDVVGKPYHGSVSLVCRPVTTMFSGYSFILIVFSRHLGGFSALVSCLFVFFLHLSKKKRKKFFNKRYNYNNNSLVFCCLCDFGCVYIFSFRQVWDVHTDRVLVLQHNTIQTPLLRVFFH